MVLLPADYVLAVITLIMAVTGLFRGFSGTIAFLIGTIVASFAGVWSWNHSPEFTQVLWMRAGGTLVISLLAFGIVRLIVKKLVNGLLAQPTDAIVGFFTGIIFGGLLLLAWAGSGYHLEYSNLATLVATYVG